MKQSPDLTTIQGVMEAGVLTKDGFLGNDMRSLAEIIAEDEGALARLDVTPGEVHDALAALTMAAIRGLGAPMRVEGRFEVSAKESMGVLPCPFGHPTLYPKAVVKGQRLDTGEKLRWTPLAVHLIGTHHFFQGRGSPFRLEPEKLVRFLFGD